MPTHSGLDPTTLDRLRDLLLSRRGVLWLRRAAAAMLLLVALALAVSQGGSAVEITTGLGRTG